MRKLIGSVLALALFPGFASADVLKNLKTSGEFEYHGYKADNVTDFTKTAHDTSSVGRSRLILNADADLLDDVVGSLTFVKNDRAYGTAAQSVDGGGAGAGILGNLVLQQANVGIKNLFGHLNTKLGRQFYGMAGATNLYFGPSRGYAHGQPQRDGLGVTAIDGLSLECSSMASEDGGHLKALFGTVAETGAVSDGDTTIAALDFATKLMGLNVGAYGINRRIGRPFTTTALNTRPDNLYVLGAKVGTSLMDDALTVGAEALANRGDASDSNRSGALTGADAIGQYRGWGFLANAWHKWGLDGAGKFKWGGSFAYGSGDNAGGGNDNNLYTVASDYRKGLIYGGHVNGTVTAFGVGQSFSPAANLGGENNLANRMITQVGVSFMPDAWEKLAIDLNGYNYQLTKSLGAGGKSFGTEVDLEIGWKHSDNVWLGVNFATFRPGGFIRNAVGAAITDSVNRCGSNLTVRF